MHTKHLFRISYETYLFWQIRHLNIDFCSHQNRQLRPRIFRSHRTLCVYLFFLPIFLISFMFTRRNTVWASVIELLLSVQYYSISGDGVSHCVANYQTKCVSHWQEEGLSDTMQTQKPIRILREIVFEQINKAKQHQSQWKQHTGEQKTIKNMNQRRRTTRATF